MVLLNRSSCARSACNTSHTILYFSLSARATSGSTPAGIPIGKMIYPYCLDSLLRMTRPTDWIMSTMDFRGFKNITASSAGTSTPSDKQRAFDKTRQASSPASCFSHSILFFLSRALKPPSTCFSSTVWFLPSLVLILYSAWISSNIATNFLLCSMVCVKATARRIGCGSFAK